MSTSHLKRNSSIPQKEKSIIKSRLLNSNLNPYSTRTRLNLAKKVSNSRSDLTLQERQKKDMNSLIKTNEHSLVLQEINHLREIKAEHNDHFNPYLTSPKLQQSRKMIGGKRGGRSRSSQNLKNIAKHLKLLIANNKNLTVKEIGYLLYQIIGKTKLGQEIVQQNCLNISQQTKKQLALKYFDQESGGPSTKHLIRNVRRRLYDALNVMISTSIIKKHDKILELSYKEILEIAKRNEVLQPTNRKEEKGNQKNNPQKALANLLQQTQDKVQKKRRLLQQTKRRYSILKMFIQAKKQNRQIQNAPLFQFPLAIITGDPSMRIELQRESLSITSPRQIKFMTDMDIIQLKLGGKISEKDEVRFKNEIQEEL